VLYHNAAFRDALYRTPTAQRSDAEETVVSALQKIFADLEIGERSSCDVNILTDLLGLEVSVQQDPQEFGKLFMAKVEECVGGDAFVADVFRGRQTYETTCSECHNVTARAADFDELEVALRGQSSVGDCVRCHFNPESLEGDNQYHCERCGKKVDAERRLKIVKAPPVLQVQLLRYVYDRVTWEKKKLRDAIETTASIKIDEDGASVDYDLCALVLHRGESAHGADSASS
jgi:ubiquitin carboxyl-terminal hydrolase 48